MFSIIRFGLNTMNFGTVNRRRHLVVRLVPGHYGFRRNYITILPIILNNHNNIQQKTLLQIKSEMFASAAYSRKVAAPP